MKLKIRLNPRLHIPTGVLVMLAFIAIAFVVALIRFANGIGAISNLNNTYPWGFWISFDLYTGIAISSGAFILAGTVYIFEIKSLRPLLRATLLTALLGYLMEIVALLVDLGRPERIWHLLVYQNHHSFLFAIGMYVMAYTVILAVEFSPVMFESLKWEKWSRLVNRFMLPVVILGVVISTLHQSSLGALLLIESAKLYPLWWTPYLPLLFFVSSIAIGLAMVIFESSLSSRAFHRGLEIDLLDKLARAIPIVLGIYLVLKFATLALAGDLQYLFNSGLLSFLFWAEIVLSVLVPMILFLRPAARRSPRGLLVGAAVLLLGMILNRFNVSWFGIHRLDPVTYVPAFMNTVHYLPSLPEVFISIGIFSGGILVFALGARYLPLFEAPEADAGMRQESVASVGSATSAPAKAGD